MTKSYRPPGPSRQLRPRQHNYRHNVMPRASAARGYNINEQAAS